MSSIALSTSWLSWKPWQGYWFQRTTNRKWHMGYQMVTWPMTSREPETWKDKLVIPIQLERNILKTAGDATLATVANYYLVCCEAVRSAILATDWLLDNFLTYMQQAHNSTCQNKKLHVHQLQSWLKPESYHMYYCTRWNIVSSTEEKRNKPNNWWCKVSE